MLTRRPFLTGLVAAVAGAIAGTLPTQGHAAGRQGFRYGWDPAIAAPTRADLYVSPQGDDRASGAIDAPLRTIQRGVDLLAQRRGGSLAIRGGIYRETVNLGALHGTSEQSFSIHRYGSERVTITAAERLGGWAPCPDTEAHVLGIKGKGVYVARLPLTDIKHGAISALNLYEAGQWRSMAIDRSDVSDPATYGDPNTYHQAEFALDKEDRILAIRDPRLRKRTAKQLIQTQVLLYHRPNLVSVMNIAKFSPARGELILAEPGPKLQGSRQKPVMRYALRGAGWALNKNTWIARRTGEDEVSVYFKPENPAHLDRDIEVSLRPTCIDFAEGRHIEIFGIEAIRAAGADRRSGICMRRTGTQKDARAGDGLTITHCRVGETLSTGRRGYGAISLRNVQGLTLRNVSLDAIRGGFGLSVLGGENADMRFLHIARVSNSPARFFTLRRSVLAFSFFEHSAYDAHANKFNFYEGSDAVLVYGVRCRNVDGFATYQEASRIHFAFCELNCDPDARNRALVSQNRRPGANQGGPDGSGDPVLGQTFYYWNNSLLPDRQHLKKANGLQVGPLGSSQRHGIFNNVLHGGGFAKLYTERGNQAQELRSHNRYTGLSFWQSAKYGWYLKAFEETVSLNHKQRGGGRDMRPIIEKEIASLFPGFDDWNLDIDGNVVDWTAPPIGSRV